MKRNALLCLAVALLIGIFQPPQPIHADHQHGPTITLDQLNAVFRRVPFPTPLTSEPIFDRRIDIVNGQFVIFIKVKNKAKTDLKFYYMWLKPQAVNGKVRCTITQIQVEGKLLNQRDLAQPNPYFASLNGDAYCNSFLSPFLVGYGPGSVVNKITLKYRMVLVDLGGALLPDAPHPMIVAGCSIYGSWVDLNLRSGPGREYPVLLVIKSFDEVTPVIDWRGDWLKISHKSIVGWIWKHYVGGTIECLSDYYRVDWGWEHSNRP